MDIDIARLITELNVIGIQGVNNFTFRRNVTITGNTTIKGDLRVDGGDIGISADTNSIQLTANNVDINGTLLVTGVITGASIQADPWTGDGGNTISNSDEANILFQGVGGADNTDITFDLDGTRPVISSATDTIIEIA